MATIPSAGHIIDLDGRFGRIVERQVERTEKGYRYTLDLDLVPVPQARWALWDFAGEKWDALPDGYCPHHEPCASPGCPKYDSAAFEPTDC